ncbi:acyl-CoA N-acyltransferase [Gorgonomyces haynaldii]|nr:acyl-CoA N-acyltransferase [Gorgonomyces haynaldii]
MHLITAETLPIALEFIAKHNQGLKCMLLDETPDGILADFKNFEIDPFTDMYHSNLLSFGGLMTDDPVTVIGPWAQDHATKVQMLKNLIEIAKRKCTLLQSAMLKESEVSVFEECGFQFHQFDLEMELRHQPHVLVNPEAKCFILDPTDTRHIRVQELHRSLFQSNDYCPENWQKIDNVDHWVAVCVLQDQIVSYAIVQRQDKNVYLANIGTDPSFQRQKLGATLLLFVREWYLTSGFKRLHLNVSLHKQHASKLYESVGFEITSKAWTGRLALSQ